ncbi:DUF3141 domain-containing protein [Cupriavidus basilensis]
MAWVSPAANAVKANRQALDAEHPLRQREQAGAEVLSAGLDAYRAVRDAADRSHVLQCVREHVCVPACGQDFAGRLTDSRPPRRNCRRSRQRLAAIERGAARKPLPVWLACSSDRASLCRCRGSSCARNW